MASSSSEHDNNGDEKTTRTTSSKHGEEHNCGELHTLHALVLRRDNHRRELGLIDVKRREPAARVATLVQLARVKRIATKRRNDAARRLLALGIVEAE